MKEQIISICTEYGDAAFRIFHISLSPLSALPKAHSHQYYELHLCVHGVYNYRIGEKQVTLCPNQMLIIPPNASHLPVFDTGERYHSAVLSFSLSKRKGKAGYYRAFEEALQKNAENPIPIDPSLIRHLHDLNEADWSGSLRSYCQLKAAASALIFSFFEAIGAFDCAERSGGLERDREDLRVLLDNLLNNRALSLREIAERINYSQRHTARLIQKHYHMSLSELRKKQHEQQERKES